MNAKLIKHNGAMTISINGVLYPFVTFKLTEVNDDKLFIDTVRSEVPEMTKRGLHIYFVPVYFGWTGKDIYDFSPVDWRIKEVLKADKDGYVVIRIHASAMNPKWWLEKNPDSIVKFGCGREPELPKSLYQTEPSPSLASNFWEEAGIPAILTLATHVKQQQYSSRIIGYLPTAYNSNEWFFRTYDDLQVNDLCPIMQKAFNKYMQEKTCRDIVFSVPDRIHRGYADYGYFIHPDPTQAKFPVVEFYRFLNSLCTEKIIKITAALREIYAPDRIIIGAFYGYSLGLANAYWLADSVHLNIVQLLEEDGPDFICSPLDYFVRNNRDLPSGGFCWAQGTQPDSALIHNKAYFAEDDYRPYTNKRDDANSWMKGPDNIEEDVEMLKRNFVFSLCKGQLQWWYDLGGHWYESKERLDAVEQCVKIANISLKRNRNQISQVAVVMDEKASWYLTLDRQMQWTVFWENFFCSFSGIGAPVDLLLLTDL